MIGWEERSQWLRLTYRIAGIDCLDWVKLGKVERKIRVVGNG